MLLAILDRNASQLRGPRLLRSVVYLPHLSGSVDVLMYSENILLTPVGALFEYKEDVIVDALVPSFGPERGGTEITLVGDNFDEDDILVCAFSGHRRSRATILSSQSAVCSAPRLSPGVWISR